MVKKPSFWTEELFQSLEIGQRVEGPKGATHRTYLMNRILAPKRFVSREHGTVVERVA